MAVEQGLADLHVVLIARMPWRQDSAVGWVGRAALLLSLILLVFQLVA